MIKTFRRESQLQKIIQQEISKRYGLNVWYYHPSDRYRNGIPDILMTFYTMFVAIELKKNIKTYKATKMQEYNLSQIKLAGGHILVSESIEEIIDFLESLINI